MWWEGIWIIAGVALPIMGIMLYGWRHNRQVDKYNEWVKEHGEPEEATQG